MFANDGYRPNVGIIICNNKGQVFWARRVKRDGWQFPQGGVSRDESLISAMYRELYEETGISQDQVQLVAHTKSWLHYDLPRKFLRPQRRRMKHRPKFKGQKQVWFLLQLLEDDSVVDLRGGIETPEFDTWRWVETKFALDNIVDFKRSVYRKALSELSQYLPTS
ncbi:MAG: RNA pyrophosphohydrolase [Gammaproteobacteria bacterium]|nr:RNA pyrophosphohydrolase [Gammaproteobacteria bacterium]